MEFCAVLCCGGPARGKHPPASMIHRLQGPSASRIGPEPMSWGATRFRACCGARLSLAVSVSVVAVSLALGLSIGGLAGYLGGWVDTALTTFAMNTFLALPGILLAIAFAAFLGPGFSNLVLALAIGGWAGYARLVRAQVMAVRDREYVDAARALGASGMRIFFPPHPAQHCSAHPGAGCHWHGRRHPRRSYAVVFGIGHSRARAQLGIDAQRCAVAPVRLAAPGLFPAAAVAGAVLGFNFLGDALRDRLDPRTRLELGL
jgi:peptide/nickel transport system permease protein